MSTLFTLLPIPLPVAYGAHSTRRACCFTIQKASRRCGVLSLKSLAARASVSITSRKVTAWGFWFEAQIASGAACVACPRMQGHGYAEPISIRLQGVRDGKRTAMSETNKLTIASLTVAYNGAAVLPRQLNALRRQTHKLDEIIVVDNASSDDSVHLLEAEFPEVTILRQPSNVGVGGGLSIGLEYAARQKKYDWIWLFDQDSIPV